MPRKKLNYTHEFPYHVFARSNNREWFYLPKGQVWEIFKNKLKHIVIKYEVLLHSFVLMDNHYHLLITTSSKATLGEVMCDFQKSVSRRINSITGRINHVFGGPYKASLIKNEGYYFHIYKYIYRNPIEAGICNRVEDYPFSSLIDDGIGVCSPITGIANMVPVVEKLAWLNQDDKIELLDSIRKGLKKTEFKLVFPRR